MHALAQPTRFLSRRCLRIGQGPFSIPQKTPPPIFSMMHFSSSNNVEERNNSRLSNWLRNTAQRFSRTMMSSRVRVNNGNSNKFSVSPSSEGSGNRREEVDPGVVQGTTLRVLRYPHPSLRNENAQIVHFTDELRTTAEEMLLLMYAADGIGLAAPQVGVNLRLMVFNELGDPYHTETEMVLCNPIIISQSEETSVKEEGCLSFPRINGHVKRALRIEVEYQDINGVTHTTRLKGMNARIFQHEYDHLNKVLFIDRFSPRDKARSKRRLDMYTKKYGVSGAL